MLHITKDWPQTLIYLKSILSNTMSYKVYKSKTQCYQIPRIKMQLELEEHSLKYVDVKLTLKRCVPH